MYLHLAVTKCFDTRAQVFFISASAVSWNGC